MAIEESIEKLRPELKRLVRRPLDNWDELTTQVNHLYKLTENLVGEEYCIANNFYSKTLVQSVYGLFNQVYRDGDCYVTVDLSSLLNEGMVDNMYFWCSSELGRFVSGSVDQERFAVDRLDRPCEVGFSELDNYRILKKNGFRVSRSRRGSSCIITLIGTLKLFNNNFLRETVTGNHDRIAILATLNCAIAQSWLPEILGTVEDNLVIRRNRLHTKYKEKMIIYRARCARLRRMLARSETATEEVI